MTIKHKQNGERKQRNPRDFLSITLASPEDRKAVVLDQAMLGHQAATFFAQRDWKDTGHTSGPLFGEWLDDDRGLYLWFAAPGGYGTALDTPQRGFERNQDYVLGWLAALHASHSSKIVWAGEWMILKVADLDTYIEDMARTARQEGFVSQNRALIFAVETRLGLDFMAVSLNKRGEVRYLELSAETLSITAWKRQIKEDSSP